MQVKELSPRSRRYMAALATDDPLVVANALIDEALVLQDQGDFAAAETLLDEADEMLVAA